MEQKNCINSVKQISLATPKVFKLIRKEKVVYFDGSGASTASSCVIDELTPVKIVGYLETERGPEVKLKNIDDNVTFWAEIGTFSFYTAKLGKHKQHSRGTVDATKFLRALRKLGEKYGLDGGYGEFEELTAAYVALQLDMDLFKLTSYKTQAENSSHLSIKISK